MTEYSSPFCRLLLVALLVLLAACSKKQQDDAFERVAASSISEAQRESALFFRSVLLSDSSPRQLDSIQGTGGELVSLNPADPQIPPAILNTVTGTLTSIGETSKKIDGVEILRVLELGAFAGKYAAAKARIHYVGGGVGVAGQGLYVDAWGYVDASGQWVIAPLYETVSVPVNRWGVVGNVIEQYSTEQRERHILDLETKAFVPIPPEYALRDEALEPLGPHVFFWMNRKDGNGGAGFGYHMINADTGKILALPTRPAFVHTDNTQSIVLEDDSTLELATGTVLPRLDSFHSQREILPGLVVLWKESDHGPTITIWDAQRRVAIASGLRTAEKLTSDLFIACDQASIGLPSVRRSFKDPRPIDPEGKLHCGLMDAKGEWRVASKYQHFHLLENKQILLRNAQEWCLFNLAAHGVPACGKQVPPEALGASGVWMDVDAMPNSDADSLYGYRDGGGALKIPFRFERAEPFVGKVAAVKRFGVPGLIDPKGVWLTPEPPGHVVDLVLESNVRADGSPCDQCFGLIDRKGQWVWPPVFSDGLTGPESGQFWVAGRSAGDLLLIDINGNVLKRSGSRNTGRPPDVSAGEPEVLLDKIVATRTSGKWGLTDTEGSWLVQPQFNALEVMSDSRALAETGSGWGMINAVGEWVVPAQFASFDVLNPEFAMGCNQDRSVCTIFNADGGRAEIAQQLKTVLPFDAMNMAAAQVTDTELWGYISRQGKWLIEPSFVKASAFNGSFALAQEGTHPQRQAVPPQALASAYLVNDAWVWPSAKLAVVSVLPKALVAAAQSKDWPSKRNVQINTARLGLMDTDGQWLIPKNSYWSAQQR